MKEEVILKIENVSKQYRLGLIGTGTISHDLNRFWARVRGKEDPYLKIGDVNDRAEKAQCEYVWALKGINFEVKRGEILGIIGKNGAGKSTLLKILSKVTGPTSGEIKSRGRIASLLEVGTGFHPEMTGKENVFLNGAILGMTKKEIALKFNEIVEFSGCERYIDTPVKRYSSGMKVRLAFAVAAFLEPDILVVDEVLAVGDAEFQKKAIGKMQDISNTDGRTVLFVSHDMTAIKNLCTSLLVISNGAVSFKGKVKNGIDYYLSNKITFNKNEYVNNDISINSLGISDDKNVEISLIEVYKKVKIKTSIEFMKNIPSDFKIEFFIKDLFGQTLSTVSSWLNSVSITPKKRVLDLEICLLNGFPFKEGEYTISIRIFSNKIVDFEDLFVFELVNSIYTGYKFPLKPMHGKVYIPNRWEIKN